MSKRSAIPQETRERFVALYHAGIRLADIVRQTGYPRSTIEHWLFRSGKVPERRVSHIVRKAKAKAKPPVQVEAPPPPRPSAIALAEFDPVIARAIRGRV